ncbi:hypothetical protein [Micromonospora deserti]|uniref:Uncharacterized protein n=1 Tax=Micromonospora deserti TaxID=2070366 RepID=A0A2W2DC30_9ACTN|nr:hypothetical protein [Micromonospora deserti]PZG01509.1 hypothetical protein C1I99_06780 [Micromonospora deserti]
MSRSPTGPPPEVLATIRALVAKFVSEYTRKTGRTPDFGAEQPSFRGRKSLLGVLLDRHGGGYGGRGVFAGE